MQRIVPEILLQFHLTHLNHVVLFARRLVLLAVVSRIFVNGCLRVGFRVGDDVGEEGVRVEVEDCCVRVLVCQVGGKGGEARVPVRDGARGHRVAPFPGEGHDVEGRDVEDQEVAGAGLVELEWEGRDLAVDLS